MCDLVGLQKDWSCSFLTTPFFLGWLHFVPKNRTLTHHVYKGPSSVTSHYVQTLLLQLKKALKGIKHQVQGKKLHKLHLHLIWLSFMVDSWPLGAPVRGVLHTASLWHTYLCLMKERKKETSTSLVSEISFAFHQWLLFEIVAFHPRIRSMLCKTRESVNYVLCTHFEFSTF